MKGATAFVIYMTRFVIFKETETVNPNPSHRGSYTWEDMPHLVQCDQLEMEGDCSTMLVADWWYNGRSVPFEMGTLYGKGPAWSEI